MVSAEQRGIGCRSTSQICPPRVEIHYHRYGRSDAPTTGQQRGRQNSHCQPATKPTIPMTQDILESPIINGTPSGSGLPTLILKRGTTLANYTRTAATFADVDSTNLKYTVVVPVGWALTVICRLSGFSSSILSNLDVRLLDSTASTVLDEQILTTAVGINVTLGYSLVGYIKGDGKTHSISLQFTSSVSPNQVNIANGANDYPKMLFTLQPAN